MVAAWEANHSKHDPYVVVKYGKYCYLLCCSYAHLIIVGLTEANVKLLLAKQEEVLVAQGTPPLHNKWNMSTFIIAGLGLEDLQFITQLIVSMTIYYQLLFCRWKMVHHVKNNTILTLSQKTELIKYRIHIHCELTRFQSIQKIFMPTTLHYLSTTNLSGTHPAIYSK